VMIGFLCKDGKTWLKGVFAIIVSTTLSHASVFTQHCLFSPNLLSRPNPAVS
jgi:hypothetical protein